MIWVFDVEKAEQEILVNAQETLEKLNQLLIDSTLEGNNDVVVSPPAQALIMSLNGYIGQLRDKIVNPLEQNIATVEAQLDSLKNFTKTAEAVINKAQRATSQITAMMKRV